VELVQGQLVRALTVLGGASVVAGGVLAAVGATPRVRAFGQQSAGWGAVDLAIAGLGSLRPPTDVARLRRVLLVNAALDLGYVAAGAEIALRRRTFGGKATPEQARGHGLAVVVQGAALFALDSVFARRASRHTG
jgi:uncharacterized protein DUF6992